MYIFPSSPLTSLFCDAIDRCAIQTQASFFGQTGAVRALLHGVANPNAQDTEGCTPIFLAAQEGHEEASVTRGRGSG